MAIASYLGISRHQKDQKLLEGGGHIFHFSECLAQLYKYLLADGGLLCLRNSNLPCRACLHLHLQAASHFKAPQAPPTPTRETLPG